MMITPIIQTQKDMHTLVLNDQDAIIKHDKSTLIEHDMRHEVKNNAHYSVEKERRTMIHAEDHHTISERKTVIINNDSITVQGTSHQKYKDKLLIDANEEVHVKVGNKMVLEVSEFMRQNKSCVQQN